MFELLILAFSKIYLPRKQIEARLSSLFYLPQGVYFEIKISQGIHASITFILH